MWVYQKRLLYPIDIKKKDLKMAKVLFSAYGGSDGELGAALRYLNQRYHMPDERGMALLTDIGTEEIGHIEMICTMIYQLMKDATLEEIRAAGLEGMYVTRGRDLFPQDNSGVPFTAASIGAVGDHIADLYEDMAAEQKARAGYEHLLDLATDQDVINPLLYLREREVVHFNMFKELLEYYQEKKK